LDTQRVVKDRGHGTKTSLTLDIINSWIEEPKYWNFSEADKKKLAKEYWKWVEDGVIKGHYSDLPKTKARLIKAKKKK